MANVWSLKKREGLIKDFIKICILIFIIMCTISIVNFPNGGLNIVKDVDLPKVVPDECLRVGYHTKKGDSEVDYIVCLKEKELITDFIKEKGIWEPEYVKGIVNAISLYPKAAYLDIGSNVGPHVCLAAKLTASVYAVDPSKENLAMLSTSLLLEGTSSHAVFINNIVSDENTELFAFQQDPVNTGGTNFLKKEALKGRMNFANESSMGSLRSVTFQQILDFIPEENIILKIDVEGSECKVLNEFLHKEKKQKFIPFILMEWRSVQRNWEGLCHDLRSFIQGFQKAGYSPFTVGFLSSVKQISESDLKNHIDVLWIHKNAKTSLDIVSKKY